MQFLRSQPFHIFERVGKTGPAASSSVKRVDEAVGFIAGVDEDSTASVKHQRLCIVPENRLFPFRQRSEWKSVGPTVLLKGLLDGAEVGFAAVNKQQIRPLFLPFRPSDNDFFHHPKVVDGVAFDHVLSVLVL